MIQTPFLPVIAWSPSASGFNRTLRNLGEYLQASQWLDVQEIVDRQLSELTTLLAHAYRYVPHYRQHLSDPTAGCEEATLLDMPILSRPTLQCSFRRLCATSQPAHHGPIDELQTSGSTGQPVRIRKTRLCQLYWTALMQRDDLWHNRDIGACLAAIRTHVGVQPGRRAAVRPQGDRHSLSIATDVEQQVIWLNGLDPVYLLTYPTNLSALLEQAVAGKLRLTRLREVRTIAEALPDHLRDECRRVLGVRLTDLYSSQELGVIALQCPDSGLYHVQSENVIVEVLDERGHRCGEGEVGRVVATDLHNYATPLIRYDLGDYAEVGPACPCGRGLPTLRRILGRERELVRLPGGRRHWPIVGIHRFREVLPGLRQFQMIQHSLDRIEVRLVVSQRPHAEHEERFRMVIREALRHPFTIDLKYCDEALPRSAGGKYQEFVCAMDAPEELSSGQ
jgi:phenylacetate-CoA ligase